MSTRDSKLEYLREHTPKIKSAHAHAHENLKSAPERC